MKKLLAGLAAAAGLALAPEVRAAEAPRWTAEGLLPAAWRSGPSTPRPPIGASGCAALAAAIRDEAEAAVPAGLRAAVERRLARAGRRPADGSLLVALLALGADGPEPAAWAAARLALLAPDDPLSAANLGVLAALAGREASAAELLAHAAARAADARWAPPARLLASLGWARLEGGDLDGAERALSQAARAEPGDVAAWQGLAAVSAARGGWAAARDPVRRAVALADTPAVRAMRAALEAAPRPERAGEGSQPEESLAALRALGTGERVAPGTPVDLATPEVPLVPGVLGALAPAIEADVAARTAALRADERALASLRAAPPPPIPLAGDGGPWLARSEGRPLVHLLDAAARLRAEAGPALAALARGVEREVTVAQRTRGALLARARDGRDRCAGDAVCAGEVVAAHCRTWDESASDTHRLLRTLHAEAAASAAEAADRFAQESAAALRELGPGPARRRAELERRAALEEVILALRAPLVPWAAFASGATPLCTARAAAATPELVALATAAPALRDPPPGRCALDGAALDLGAARLLLSCDAVALEGDAELLAELASLRGPGLPAELGVACAATPEAALGAGPARTPGVVLTLAEGVVVDVAPLGPASPAGEPLRGGACALRLGPPAEPSAARRFGPAEHAAPAPPGAALPGR